MGPLKLVPLGYQQIAAATLASATNLTVPTGANVAIISAETAGIRWRDDGTSPTGSIGMVIAAGGSLDYYGNLAAVQLILQSGSPIADIAYYKIAG